MDALSDVLRTMRMRGGVFLHGEFHDPWCLSVKIGASDCAPYLSDTAHIIPYHFVLDGEMAVLTTDGHELRLGQGDSVLFPRNDPHLLGSDLTRPPVPGDAVVQPPSDGGLARIVLGGNGAATCIVCGFLGADEVRGNPVVATLPPVLRLDRRDVGAADWVRSTFAFAAREIAAGRLGSETVMAKLSELLFVEAVRAYAETLPAEEKGWLAGLRDPFVSRALALLHARPGAAWTIQELGRQVGLSRSALADRFADILGMPPMQYLARWRIHAAAYDLLNTGKSILGVALDAGYDSEAAFSRAFKRVMGLPPAAWRRRRTGEAATARDVEDRPAA